MEAQVVNKLGLDCGFNFWFQVLKLNNLAVETRPLLTLSASAGECVLSPTVGQSVLVFYKFSGEGVGGEWCRGAVETI